MVLGSQQVDTPKGLSRWAYMRCIPGLLAA